MKNLFLIALFFVLSANECGMYFESGYEAEPFTRLIIENPAGRIQIFSK